MIWESHYWKRDLEKDADIIERWAKKKRSIKQDVLLEKKIFLAAYAIRKLIESHKICDHLTKTKVVAVKKIKGINFEQEITLLNNHHLDKFYNFDDFKTTRIHLYTFASSIIHSLIFDFKVSGEQIVGGFFVASSFNANPENASPRREKADRYMFEIQLSDFIVVLKSICNSGIAHAIIENGKPSKLSCGAKNCLIKKRHSS
jgi:hypothetical protein